MTIAALTIVKNGADIIEPFIRHNAAHVDCFLICDHQSTDGTPEILEKLRNEGYRILPYHVRSDVFRQARWMTFLGHESKALIPGLRYAVPLDVDEFIHVRSGSLESALDSHFKHHNDPVCLMPWVTYVPTPGDDPAQPNPTLRIRHRFASEPAQYRKVVLPAATIRFLLNIGAGSHAAMYLRHKLKGGVLDNVDLCHFPIRNLVQVRQKAIEGAEASREIWERKPNINIHWKELAEGFQTTSREMNDLEYVARRYLGAAQLNDSPIVHGDFSYLETAVRDVRIRKGAHPNSRANHPRLLSLLRRWPGPSDPQRLF